MFRLFTYPKGNISNYEMFISPQDVLFLFLLSVSSDVQEISLLILKTVYVEQGGIVSLHAFVSGSKSFTPL